MTGRHGESRSARVDQGHATAAPRFPPAPRAAIRCHACPARRSGICAPLTAAELADGAEFRSGLRALPAHGSLFRAGDRMDACMMLTSGWVALVTDTADGQRQVLDIALPGALLGFQVEGDPIAQHGAEALNDVTVCVLDTVRLRRAVRTDTRLAMRLSHLTSCSEHRAHEHLTNLGLRPARARVANLLLELALRLTPDRVPAAGDVLRVPLRLVDIGQALALSPEHVSRMLSELRRAGVLDLRRGRLRVLDLAAWQQEAG